MEPLRDAPLIQSASSHLGARPTAAPPRATSADIRAVIVDDHPLICQAVQRTLVGAGYHVVGIASDGATGLELVMAEQPDVVIVDLVLPDIGGAELIQAIREAGSGTRVLIFSATPVEAMPPEAVSAADAVVTKTSAAGDLIEAVNAVVLGARAGRESA